MFEGEIMKSNFIRELETKQEMTVNYWGDSSVRNHSFYVEYVCFSVTASEEKYLLLLEDEKLKIKFYRLSEALGVTIYLSRMKQKLTIKFQGRGFFCYRKYYGIFRQEVEEKFRAYLPELRIADGEVPKSLKTVKTRHAKIIKEVSRDLQEKN